MKFSLDVRFLVPTMRHYILFFAFFRSWRMMSASMVNRLMLRLLGELKNMEIACSQVERLQPVWRRNSLDLEENEIQLTMT
ncbi:hypothetical protein BI380_32680 [Delftia tsuruhatensis]|uniref:Uncharacterized protein n=1 Tax=Delftia tsuruhatensis TaxID=180282 RepID=A0ABN4SQH3_9BURK|nr:hypothetical protein BI380_32680 [Delftia tsuruhatensis]